MRHWRSNSSASPDRRSRRASPRTARSANPPSRPTRLSDRSGGEAYRQRFDRAQEVRVGVDRLVQYFDLQIAVQDFLPEDAQLKFGETVAEAAVNTEAEGEVLARAGAIGDQVIRVLDRLLVAVPRDVPDHDLVSLLDRLAADFRILERGAPHMDHRGLPADDLGHEARDQRRVVPNFAQLVRVLAYAPDAARHRVAGRVVPADEKED